MFSDLLPLVFELIMVGFVVKVILSALIHQDDRDRDKWGG
jgi:hypothetical protein